MLWIDAVIVFFLNLPFGYWRARVRKFSWQWFLAVHFPVPVIVALRIYSDLGWQFITYVVLVSAYGIGQYAGGRVCARQP